MVMTRTCGFSFTTTGRPCGNRVAEGAPWCRAGHPCEVPGTSDELLSVALGRSGLRPAPCLSHRRTRPHDRGRRATELLRQALSSDDAEQGGLHAEHILADEGAALMLLGSPDASAVARAAVIQRFGHVGAFLVVGYEDRWRRHAAPGPVVDGPPGPVVDAAPGPVDGAAHCIESLVRDFALLDARQMDRLLRDIDRAEDRPGDGDGHSAHRWLHATYAVAARDGNARSHRAYLRALDRVLRLVGPLVLP
jgi:hypothetical protein